MKKVIMNLDKYKGNFCMHCPTKESAQLFCLFLHQNRRCWNDGTAYLVTTYWDKCKENTVYFFNEGFYSEKKLVDENYEILEIEDFIQDVDEKKVPFKEIESHLKKARNAVMKHMEEESAIFAILDALQIDASLLPTNAENASNLSEAISCFIQYGEYGLNNIMKEIKQACKEDDEQ